MDYSIKFPDLRMEAGTELRRAQLVMLRLLRIFDDICCRHGLEYWLDAGTLLGAARHGGFIPWDDDVDVMMPVNHYASFLKIAQAELPFDVFLQTKQTDPEHDISWAKLRDRFSYMDDPGGPYPYSQGIPIDIFPAYVQTKRQFRLRFLYSVLPPFGNQPDRMSKRFSWKHNAHNLVLGTIQRIFLVLMKIQPLRKAFIAWGQKSGGEGWCYNPERPWYQHFPLECVHPLSKITFEDVQFSAPADVDRYLSIYYGDWRTPPANPANGSHGIHGIHLSDAGPKPHSTQLEWKDYHPDA
ncbi:MAG TPA: LicD family protein [Spirochaetales bacterium]|nr:LicD family protein [Spirochaetales bacterium]